MEEKVKQISKGVNPEIFRAYDIRGVYPSAINEKVAYLIGRAFVNFLKKRKPKIVVGQDNRLSSPPLFKALKKGILEQGGNLIDIGLVTTPIFYFAVAHFKFDGGIQITASHNPPQYNGFKLVREEAIPISSTTGLEEIKYLVLKGKFEKAKRGKIRKKEVLEEYLKFNLKDFDLKKISPLKIVIDTANAVPGIIIPEISKKIPAKIHHLFAKLDGNFPNHPPDPLVKEKLRVLCQEVKRKKADLGVAFDGDGDRIVFIDEKSQVISGDLITALISKPILGEKPGEKILYDVRSSRILPETIKKAGGKGIVGRVGHSFIKERMRKENIIFAGEFSGHYYHREHYFSEAPLFVLFKILEEISQSKKSLSELILPFRKYYHSGEINFEIAEKERKIKEMKDRYRDGKALEIDGLRVDFKDWWFLVRPSQTEPLLRLIIEAKSKKLMEKKKKELTTLITSNNL